MDQETYERLRHLYQKGCVFCEPANELILAATASFGVCLDVAPLAVGHCIIHSTEHHGCAGEVPPDLFGELKSVKAAVAHQLRRTYGGLAFYEHGRAGHCLSDGPEHRLCHHFHLHCVPTSVDVSARLAKRFTAVRVSDYGELPALYEIYGDYLYVEADGDDGWFYIVDGPIERHLLRTMISDAMAKPAHADWRTAPLAPLLEEGLTASDSMRVAIAHELAAPVTPAGPAAETVGNSPR